VPSFESVRFQQGVLSLGAVRLICAAQSGFFASSTMYAEKSNSTMLNPDRSAAQAQHPRLPPSHSFIEKEPTKSGTSEFPEI